MTAQPATDLGMATLRAAAHWLAGDESDFLLTAAAAQVADIAAQI